MGLLRKKSSAIAVNFADVLQNQDASTSKANLPAISTAKSGTRPKMSPRSATAHPDEGRFSKRKKDKRRENSLPEQYPLPSGHTGISLDTNLDEMDGIVNLDNLQPFPQDYSMSGTYDHINAVTSNNSPRPGTPPSPNQVHGSRRPSVAASANQQFLPSELPGLSPIAKRLGLTRRDSADIVASMNRWSVNGGLGGLGVAADVPSVAGTVRKASIVSLMNDRRGSDGTVNVGPGVPDSGWTAPDSWAVRAGDLKGDDDSDEDFVRTDSTSVIPGSVPATPLLNGDTISDVGMSSTNGKFQIGSRRPGSASVSFPNALGGPKSLNSIVSFPDLRAPSSRLTYTILDRALSVYSRRTMLTRPSMSHSIQLSRICTGSSPKNLDLSLSIRSFRRNLINYIFEHED